MNVCIHALRPPEPPEADIRHAAYLLWEEAGRPAGRDREFWFEARQRLRRQVRVRLLPTSALSSARNAQSVGARIR